MEEFRSVMADRIVLSLINKRKIKPEHFVNKENGAVLLTDEGRKIFIQEWQNKKKETIKHPYIDEKIEWGMVPYVQAMLLARFVLCYAVTLIFWSIYDVVKRKISC